MKTCNLFVENLGKNIDLQNLTGQRSENGTWYKMITHTRLYYKHVWMYLLAKLSVLSIGPKFKLCYDLVGKRAGHYKRRMTSGTAEIQQTTLFECAIRNLRIVISVHKMGSHECSIYRH